ncbi:unnamed protein product [Rotaria sordida]|uniref:F-box domain-containing protein n=1 Tax=Rotaria sordida TaxID=392033 RepID=A0A814CFK1_9BILA|nr:unnamed protein product [Rotaria sordida]
MKFELLPNEILLLCFQYLNILDIFCSFDQLNKRFSKLIRTIQFQLNFENVKKTIFDKFCIKMKLNPEIQKQIYSLKLSNEDTCGQIDAFLSIFSLNEFSSLQSLTLSEIEKENIEKLKITLPLTSFHMICDKLQDNEIFDILPMFNLRTLSISSLHSIEKCINDTSNITNLTIQDCSLEHLLYHMFKYFPMLKYLNVKYITRRNRPIESDNNDSMFNTHNGIHLKQLIIGLLEYDFDEFEVFIKLIPNLRILIINTEGDINMMNACQWKNLIQSSLPYLNIFKFNFGCYHNDNDETILKKFKHFQDDFWCKQHQWYTEYSCEKYKACIYTIPYLSTGYILEMNTQRFPNKLINHLNTFDKVTYLGLYDSNLTDKCQDYFSNVESLILFTSYIVQYQFDISYLKMIVNLSHIKHLNMSMYERIISSREFLEILKESPKLSTITINSINLNLLLYDDELCKYLNKMITKLNICKELTLRFNIPNTLENFKSSFNNSKELKNFCKIFSNIEHLECYIMKPNHVLFLLNHLSKLSTMKIHLPPLDNYDYFLNLFKQESSRLNFIFRVKNINVKTPEVSMWIGKNMTQSNKWSFLRIKSANFLR